MAELGPREQHYWNDEVSRNRNISSVDRIPIGGNKYSRQPSDLLDNDSDQDNEKETNDPQNTANDPDNNTDDPDNNTNNPDNNTNDPDNNDAANDSDRNGDETMGNTTAKLHARYCAT
jgi:hypothetical protein